MAERTGGHELAPQLARMRRVGGRRGPRRPRRRRRRRTAAAAAGRRAQHAVLDVVERSATPPTSYRGRCQLEPREQPARRRVRVQRRDRVISSALYRLRKNALRAAGRARALGAAQRARLRDAPANCADARRRAQSTRPRSGGTRRAPGSVRSARASLPSPPAERGRGRAAVGVEHALARPVRPEHLRARAARGRWRRRRRAPRARGPIVRGASEQQVRAASHSVCCASAPTRKVPLRETPHTFSITKFLRCVPTPRDVRSSMGLVRSRRACCSCAAPLAAPPHAGGRDAGAHQSGRGRAGRCCGQPPAAVVENGETLALIDEDRPVMAAPAAAAAAAPEAAAPARAAAPAAPALRPSRRTASWP